MFHLQQLRQAIGQHLGKVLTPEAAASIEVAARTAPDESIDPARFAPLVVGDYTIAAERFSAILHPELHYLHRLHWSETEKHRHGIALNPDYPAMLARERAGRLVQFTVRHRGELVGNCRMYLGLSLHSQTLFADEDTLFLVPEHRGSFLVIHLLRYVERCLIDLGAREIRANSKLVNRADVLMRRLGYRAVATQFVKIIEGGADVL